MINSQESIELAYFQRIQVQRLEIRALKQKVGELESEVAHWQHKAELNKDDLIKAEAIAISERMGESNNKLKKQIEDLKRDRDGLLFKLLKL